MFDMLSPGHAAHLQRIPVSSDQASTIIRALLYGKPMAESADYARSTVVIYDDAHDSVHASA